MATVVDFCGPMEVTLSTDEFRFLKLMLKEFKPSEEDVKTHAELCRACERPVPMI